MNHLKDKNVLILGLGFSGLAMARWCARFGARVTVADTRETPPQRATLQTECPDVNFVSGPFDETLMALAGWKLVARSPGLPPAQLQIVKSWVEAHGVPLVGELDLFAQALQELAQRETWPYRPKVLGITGTNGKTTVTSLTGLLLQRAGVNVAVAGNIGPSLLDVLSEALDAEAAAQREDEAQARADAALLVEQDAKLAAGSAESIADAVADEVETPDGSAEGDLLDADGVAEQDSAEEQEEEAAEDGPTMLVPPPPEAPPPPHLPTVWVLELSSFQLDSAAHGPWADVPTAATVLNISDDHLDWHGSLNAYIQAKAAVFGRKALMLLNRDDERVMAFKPDNVTVKIGGRNRQQAARPWATFGFDVPTRVGDWGIETVNGMSWLVRALALDETRKRGRAADEDDETYLQRLMPVDALRIRGRHNAANALAALALATSTGAALGPMLHGLREYRGEPHRVEPVGLLDGVEFFNDSKGTNVGATLAAVLGLGVERRLVVILGGDGKGQDFSPLAQPLAQHARAVVLIGRDAPLIEAAVMEALQARAVPMAKAADMAEAVLLASQHALPGDAVLLSPACASFDMFNDYSHRASVFVDAVNGLAHARGMALEGTA
jgi:UDP-N-acetylmuramoylalanine--D-glutamate ligase